MDDDARSSPIFTLHGVTRRFERGGEVVEALRGLDLAIARGELLLVMGPSGSGKSTLLHLLGGLERPTSGEVLLHLAAGATALASGAREAPLDLARLDDERLAELRRRQLGFVFQEFHLLPTLTAQENVQLPLLLDGVAEASARAAAARRLAQVGLAARADHLPDQLSGGERQRVAIARALIADPPVLLCDEPTGSLDSVRGQEIFALLRSLAHDEGRTVVVVTHDPAAEPFADRVVRLRDGAWLAAEGGGAP
ncbi:MAG: ABC transporter ATP-binding protein [Planctomycetes bacterium]|nr:ABC transporter ATP-binding protein [Planctomycetota bacterium]